MCRELCASARGTGRTLPVWLMTAAFTGALAAKATEAGAITLLKKPFDCIEFMNDLERCFSCSPPIPMTSPILSGDNAVNAA